LPNAAIAGYQYRRLWLPTFGNYWELVWNKNPPLLSHIIAKLFYKIFLYKVIYQYFCKNVALAGFEHFRI